MKKKKEIETRFMRELKLVIEEEGTQTKVAERLGLTSTPISMWLKGKSVPSPKVALKLRDIYGIDPKVTRPDIFGNI